MAERGLTTATARSRIPARFGQGASTPPPYAGPAYFYVPPSRARRFAAGAGRFALAALWLAVRAAALVAFLLLAMGDIFLAPIVGFFALSAFVLAVLFGFVLDMIPQRWGLLTMSVVLMLGYLVYRVVMLLMLRIARGE
jgi:hypothetical protein